MIGYDLGFKIVVNLIERVKKMIGLSLENVYKII